MITRTKITTETQEKMIKIHCPDWVYSYGMYHENYRGYVFLDEPFNPIKDYDKLFMYAQQIAKMNERRNEFFKKVKVEIYWKTIETKEKIEENT